MRSVVVSTSSASEDSDPLKPAPNSGCPVAFVPADQKLAGCNAAMNCFIGRCGLPKLDPRQVRRDFCLKLTEWRRESGWSLDSLAVAVGVSPSTVSLWQTGKRFPNLENLIALGTVMSAPPCHFFCPIVSAAGKPVAPCG